MRRLRLVSGRRPAGRRSFLRLLAGFLAGLRLRVGSGLLRQLLGHVLAGLLLRRLFRILLLPGLAAACSGFLRKRRGSKRAAVSVAKAQSAHRLDILLSDRVFRLLPLHLQRREHDRRKQRRRQHHAEQNTEPAYRPKLSHRASQCKTKTPDPQTDPVFAVPTEDSNSPDLRSGRLSARVLLLPSHGFPQWLPFGPALSRFGAALSRTVLSSRSIPFSPPPAEHPGKTQLQIFGMLFFRLYHTAGAGKSLLFFACLFAGNGRLGRTENPPLSCGA